MKTTLIINDSLMNQIKAQAALQGTSLSRKVEALLRLGLKGEMQRKKLKKLPKLPSYSMGKARVDIADRDALYDFMERD